MKLKCYLTMIILLFTVMVGFADTVKVYQAELIKKMEYEDLVKEAMIVYRKTGKAVDFKKGLLGYYETRGGKLRLVLEL